MVWTGLPRAPRPRNDGGEELQHYGLDCHAALAMTEVMELQHYGLDCHGLYALAMTKKGKTENGLDYHPPRVG